jgi:branched-chain amino acid transport system ATP-binding protein
MVASHRPSLWETVRELFSRPVVHTQAVDDALSLLGLEQVAELMPEELSQGQRKLVGVARALVAHPRVICVDEPAAGLDVNESAELGRRLRGVVDQGTPVLLVDHDMGLVLGICDRVVVLEFGKVISRGKPEEVRRDARVVTAYLGSAAAKLAPAALEAPLPTSEGP